jgi:lysine-N-methylase
VSVTPAERSRIEALGWDAETDLAGLPLFVRAGRFSSAYRLNHKPDGACVFLGADNRCRIHTRHDAAAKPLACRIYPFALVPFGDHWKLGVRFACPSAAEDRGRPLADHLAEAREYAAVLEAEAGAGLADRAPPALQKSQSVSWNDLSRIITAVSKLLANSGDTPERRWRRVLFLISTLRRAKFDGRGEEKKAVTGGRLSELLHIMAEASQDEVPVSPDAVPPPGWVGRMVFRPLVALYARKDSGADRGPAQVSAFGRFFSAVAFARGHGFVPRVHAAIGSVPFAQAEKPLPELSERSSSLLARWSRVKVESGQFCGAANFGLGVWDGLESLAAAFAAIMWLARVLAAGERPIDDAVVLAVRMVDDNFGFNKLLGSARQKFALHLLGSRGELTKLVAWYGRTAARE